MQASHWRNLSGDDPRALSAARLQAHYAMQWLARAARAYIRPEPDDSHTSLEWSGAISGFETYPFRDGSHLGLGLADLSLIYSGADRAPASFSLGARTDAQARQWLREQLGARGFDPNALDVESPYAMPPHPIAGGACYDRADAAPFASRLADWFANAGTALWAAQTHLTAAGLTAPAPRCWPHHFDLATLTSFAAKSGQGTAYVGAGFSPGDHYYDEPYFYVSLYPAPDVATLSALPEIGHWHSQEFTAAIATARKIAAARDQQASVAGFLASSIDTAIASLRGGR
jgi:Family of unknown function (DUF5996)